MMPNAEGRASLLAVLCDARLERNLGMLEDVNLFQPVVPLEAPLADRDQAHVIAQYVGDDRVGRLRHEDLVADGPPPQLCASVDSGRTVVAVLGIRLPSENRHANG